MLNPVSYPIDYARLHSLSDLWPQTAEHFGDIVALYAPHLKPEVKLTYRQLWDRIRTLAAGLQSLGVMGEDRIALFADNSPYWLIADQGIMAAGAVNAVRSSQADRQELLYIAQDSDSIGLIIEDRPSLDRLCPDITQLGLRWVILLMGEEKPDLGDLPIYTLGEVLDLGKDRPWQPVTKGHGDLATLIYTSGTTGQPKGVMLSQGNILHQVTHLHDVLYPTPSDRIVSILPTWHSYERTVEYFLLARGCSQVYSNLRRIKQDLKEYQPRYMVAVPRLWEGIYEGIQKQFREQPAKKQKLVNTFLGLSQRYIQQKRIAKNLSLNHFQVSPLTRTLARLQSLALAPLHALGDHLVYEKVRQATGGQLRYVISGGGSLAPHLDDFFELVGINILVGYGLTETSPVTNVRLPHHNLRGTAGPAVPLTEIRIADPDSLQPISPGQRGLVLIRGPQVMQGYYKKPEATAQVINPEGWFNSGDLGYITPTGDLVLTGRAKDTIVLTNGENIEPQAIEDACLRSAYIDQIMLVGQDQRCLGALIVPNYEALSQWAIANNFPNDATQWTADQWQSQPVQALFRQELTREVQNRPGYRIDDRIGPFAFLPTPCTMDNGMLTQTLKIKRPIVQARYQAMIEQMFAK